MTIKNGKVYNSTLGTVLLYDEYHSPKNFLIQNYMNVKEVTVHEVKIIRIENDIAIKYLGNASNVDKDLKK